MRSKERGFTLIEIIIVSVMMVPVIMAIMGTSRLVRSSIDTNERRASVQQVLRETIERVGTLVRSAVLSTARVRATQADVDAAKAANVGDWIAPVDLDPRPNVRFQSAAGTLSLNASVLTPPREIEFRMDSAEVANGIDDDGNGLVDDGALYLLYNTKPVLLLDGVEACTFTFEDGMLRVSLDCGRVDAAGRVHRSSIEHSFHLRN